MQVRVLQSAVVRVGPASPVHYLCQADQMSSPQLETTLSLMLTRSFAGQTRIPPISKIPTKPAAIQTSPTTTTKTDDR